jgi:glycosyltransferase involved in cell wall biosynthesis
MEAAASVTATTATPRVVFGVPAYNRPDALARTLESLLGQTDRDLAVVIVDDAPSPAVKAIVDAYAASDPRVVYEANPARLGMVGNWQRAFARSRALFPASRYFAWASDHDVWHPSWIETLVPALESDPSVVMAYPHAVRMYQHERRRLEGTFDTTQEPRRARRLRGTLNGLTAGNAIYGLFRASALERAGGFRAVLLPDRLLLSALSLLGSFRHVPDMLWYREASRVFTYQRQRDTFFAGRTPLHTYLPADVQHAAALAWTFGVCGAGRPAFGRLAGLGYAAAFFWYSLRRERARWKMTLGRAAAATGARS